MSEWNRNPQPGKHMQSLPVRKRREFRPRQFFIAAGIAIAIGLIIAGAVWSDRPQARSAAGALPSASPTSTITPTAAKPGTPTPPPRPVKVSPPVASVIAGDGSWLVGKQIKRGVWRTLGDETSACFWAIRSNLSYDYDATIASSNSRSAQTVALGPNARVFVTYGCRWELVR